MGARGNWALWREVASRPPDGTIADPIVGSFSQSGADWIGWTLLLDKFLNLYFCPKVFVLFRVCKFSENHHPNFQCFLSVGSRLNGPGPIICVVFWQISKFSFLSKSRNFSPNFRFLSLGAASLMWVRHWSVVIVPPVGCLEIWWDSEMCWCFIHVTIKLITGMTQRSLIESCITIAHVSSSRPETVRRENCLLVRSRL